MKEGWKMVKLREVCEIINGKNQKEVISPEGQFPILGSGGNVMGYATEYLCPAGTIIIGRKGSINNPLFIDTPFWNVDTAFGFNARDNYERKLLYYFCLLFDFEKLNKGTTLPSLVKSDLLQIEIPLPPLEEQHRIVSILDTSFEKIDALKKNAEENLKNAKALFQQVLAQELKPKEGWVEKRLDEIATFYNGKAHEQCIDENGKYILVNSKYISSNTMVGKRTNSQLFPLYKDDIVMVMSDVPNGKALAKCLIIPTDDTHSLNQRICVFRNSKINVKLLYYLINRNPYLLSFNNGENQTNLRKNDILKMRLSYPTNEAEVEFVLNRFDEQINLINELIKKKEQTIRECDALKQSILRQAFSGEL